MNILANTYGMIVLALSVTVLVAVWKVHKDKVKADLRRVTHCFKRH